MSTKNASDYLLTLSTEMGKVNPGQLWRIHRRKSRVIRDYKPVNILFLGGARRISLAERFIDAAERLKIEPSLFSYELSENVAISGLAKIIVGLKWNHKDILKHLSKVIDDLNINIVLPFVDPATVVAAKLKKKRKDIFIPVSDESICDIFFDKRKANAWFVKNGFPVPESSSSFPLIAKPYKGSATKHVMIMKNIEDLEFFKANFNQKKYLVQRFIEGTEYTIDSYISVFGQTLSVVPRKRIEIMAGEVTKSITERELRIITLVENIFAKVNFAGPVTVQIMKERKTSKLFIIEINPRFGGGVLTSIEAGADIPYMMLNDYIGVGNKPVHKWRESLMMMRAFREVFKKCV